MEGDDEEPDRRDPLAGDEPALILKRAARDVGPQFVSNVSTAPRYLLSIPLLPIPTSAPGAVSNHPSRATLISAKYA